MQVCRYAGMQVCRYAGMQVCRYAGIIITSFIYNWSFYTCSIPVPIKGNFLIK